MFAKRVACKRTVREMTDYLSIREAAEQWGVSERRVNQFCADGRIEGAKKIGGSWVIPAEAKKPEDPRKRRKKRRRQGARRLRQTVCLRPICCCCL